MLSMYLNQPRIIQMKNQECRYSGLFPLIDFVCFCRSHERAFVKDVRTFLWSQNPEMHEMISGIKTLLGESDRSQKKAA